MILLIDYGAGNLRSVANAFRAVGAEAVVARDPADLARASKIVLPGVGAFGAGMAALREAGFIGPIREAALGGVPLLGICLGLQFLFETSDEMGLHEGLGLLPGRVTRFAEGDLKVPHIGWNTLDQRRAHPLLAGVPDGAHAYFVHSYYVDAADEGDILASTDYGTRFASVVAHGSIYGIQPHPEKSQGVGLRILKNFVEMEA